MKSFLALLTVVQLAIATPHLRRWDDLAEKHAWAEVPQGWEYRSPAPKDHMFNLKIGLKQDGIDELRNHLLETSDPFHPRYGQHLTQAEVTALVAPHPTTIEAVESWLTYHDIAPENTVDRTGSGDFVTIRVSVEQAERMLGANYNVYYRPETSEEVVRTLSYSLPMELLPHVDMVAPTTYFSTLRGMRATSFLQNAIPFSDNSADEANAAVPASCNTKITPACLRSLYNTEKYVPKKTDVNRLGIAGFLAEFGNRADLQTFYKQFYPQATNSSYETVLVHGGEDDQTKPGVEANLDIQYAASVSFPTPNIYYSTGGSPPFTPDEETPTNTNEPYLDWLNFIFEQKTIPQTISISYGDYEQTVPPDYAKTVCNSFMRLGSLGTTVFVSSGDFGVGGGNCTTNDGTKRKLFQPTFPASCPWVTTVGGTTKTNPETTVSFSGGGFSNYFGQPLYQKGSVNSYLANLGSTYKGLYNATGRAYPDLAAQGSGFQVVIGGKVNSVGGTSASAPTVAAIFALLNDYRLSQGQTSIGFANPLIYKNPQAFNDITSGSNPGCGTNGFSSTAGWDPATGLGTPDFLKLQTAVTA